jgi:YfiH family protein
VFYFLQAPKAASPGLAFTDAELDLHIHPRASAWDSVEAALQVPIYIVTQVHSDRVIQVGPESDPAAVLAEEADALVTTNAGIGLAVRIADCVPVLLWGDGVIAAAHAGRVGLERGVLQAAVAAMRRLGARKISARVGPHICGACYEVPAAMRAEFSGQYPQAASTTSWGTPALDLGAATGSVLQGLDVATTFDDPCTLTTPTLHSYRRDAAGSGRQAAIIWR